MTTDLQVSLNSTLEMLTSRILKQEVYWRRSSRGHDFPLTPELDLDNQRLLSPSPVLGMYILPTITTVGAVCKDVALREHCAVETIWTVHVTESS